METVNSLFKIQDLRIGFERPFHSTPLNFEIPRHRLTAVMGKNGSGKSTLLSSLCAGDGRLSGAIYIEGGSKSVHLMKPLELSELIAYVPQEHLFPSHFRVVDLLALARLKTVGLWGSMPGKEDAEIQKVASHLNLKDLLEKEMGSISSGERQRTFLARAILQKPKALILDEPTNHLDPKGIGDFWRMITTLLKAEEITVILSTHDLAFVEKYADYVIALEKGALLFNGTKQLYLQEKIPERIFDL